MLVSAVGYCQCSAWPAAPCHLEHSPAKFVRSDKPEDKGWCQDWSTLASIQTATCTTICSSTGVSWRHGPHQLLRTHKINGMTVSAVDSMCVVQFCVRPRVNLTRHSSPGPPAHWHPLQHEQRTAHPLPLHGCLPSSSQQLHHHHLLQQQQYRLEDQH